MASRISFALCTASLIAGVCAVKWHRAPYRPGAALRRPFALSNGKPAPRRVVEIDELRPLTMRRLMPEELTPELIRKADDLIWNHDAPLGTEIILDADGKPFVARFEEHYHAVGGPKRPWGAHKGITLYAAE